jgi:oxygen-independent coproporphyrinogen-3 oxidase
MTAAPAQPPHLRLVRPALPQGAGRPVPRYTSYPTAASFTDAVGPALYGEWLEELDPSLPLSLYVHVPFCDTLCWFCGCHTRVVNRYEPIADYLVSLKREIEAVVERVGAPTRAVRHIHFGGGTPAGLRPCDIRRLAELLHGSFYVEPGAEFAVEIDPRGLTDATVEALADAGVTRASLGVQDLTPAVQAAINRVQPFETVVAAADRLRAAGIAGLNIDLIYGLPKQTVRNVADTVDRVVALRPDRLSIFGYAHVPWMKKHQQLIHEADLPDTAARLQQLEAAQERLAAAGYVAVGLDHFARPDDPLAKAVAEGRMRRNFQGYTTDDAPALIGFGASAIGRLPQGYVQNQTDLRAYAHAVREDGLAAARGVELTDEDRLRADIIERLMCDLTVDVGAVCAEHGRGAGPVMASAAEALAQAAAEGLAVVEGLRVTVPDGARPFVRLVACAFDAHLDPTAVRFSRAV